MIISTLERFYNSTTKMFYEIRPIYDNKGKAKFEVYYAYKEDTDWNYEITKKTRGAAVKYIKSKGVK